MKRNLCGVLLLLICLCLAACGKDAKKEEKGSYKIYCLDSSESKLEFEEITTKKTDTKGLVDEFLSRLGKKLEELSYVKAIPDDVKVLDYSLNEKNELSIYFDSGYNVMKGVNEILRRAAIVKTLCQIDGVDSVQFFVDGQPISNSAETPIGYMTEDTFIDNTDGETAYRQQADLIMYFASADGEKLVAVPVVINYDATISLEQMVIEQLIAGPGQIDGMEKGDAIVTIPNGTVLNKVTVKDGVCYVDFSKEFLERRADITNEVAVYSVVNSLVELPRINKVQFQINGDTVENFMESMEFDVPFERNLDLVESVGKESTD